jgi:hypothetical protein
VGHPSGFYVGFTPPAIGSSWMSSGAQTMTDKPNVADKQKNSNEPKDTKGPKDSLSLLSNTSEKSDLPLIVSQPVTLFSNRINKIKSARSMRFQCYIVQAPTFDNQMRVV